MGSSIVGMVAVLQTTLTGQSPGFLFLPSTVTENWPVKVVCRTATIPTMLLKLIWEIRLKKLIQEKQKSWAFNFRASCNSWAASPISQSTFWAKKKFSLGLGREFLFCLPKRCLALRFT